MKEISDAMVAAKESVTPFRASDIRRTCETMLRISAHRGRSFQTNVDGVSDDHGRCFTLIMDGISP